MDQLREYAKELNVYEARIPEIQKQYDAVERKLKEINNTIRKTSNIPPRLRRNRRYIIAIRRRLQALRNEYSGVQRELVAKRNELHTHTTKIQTLKSTIGEITLRLLRTTDFVEKMGEATSVVPTATGGLTRALCIGINYTGTEYALAGCVNDANNIKTHLESTYSSCKDVVVLRDDSTNPEEKPTRANILAKFNWLVSGLKPGENVFVSYSGHGGRVRDTNGDEVTGLDGCLFPMDGTTTEIITDDEIREHLVNKIPAGCKCFIVVDACHSGTMVDMRYKWEGDAFGNVRYTEDKKYGKTAGKVVFLSGCKDEQYSMDTVDHKDNPAGALTWALLETWKRYGEKIKTKYLLWDVRNYLSSRGYSQIPQLCTGRYEDLQDIFDLSS